MDSETIPQKYTVDGHQYLGGAPRNICTEPVMVGAIRQAPFGTQQHTPVEQLGLATECRDLANLRIAAPSTHAVASLRHLTAEMSKEELRKKKNREAARICRQKRNEYIRVLEHRVKTLESQNKQLIGALKLHLQSCSDLAEGRIYAPSTRTDASIYQIAAESCGGRAPAP